MQPKEEKRLKDLLAQKHQYIEEQNNLQSSPAFTSPNGDPSSKGPLVLSKEDQAFVDDVWLVNCSLCVL